MNEVTKKNLILIGIGTFAIIALACTITIMTNGKKVKQQPMDDTEQTNEKIIENNEEVNPYMKKIVSTDYSIDAVIDKDLFVIRHDSTYRYGVMDSNGYIVDAMKYKYINVLPDGYYLLKDDNSKILKRKNNIIETNPETNKLYQDQNEENAPYVMISDECYGCGTKKLNGNYRAAHISKEYDTIGYDIENRINVIYGSIIYDAKEGKIIKEIPGRIEPSRTNENLYIGTYNNSSWYSLTTYYDEDFNNMLSNRDFLEHYQCGGNEFSTETRNVNSEYAGYFSLNQRRNILPLQYENIYSHNESETLFVVRQNGKYSLVNSDNTILLSGYDYIMNVGDYVITQRDNEFRIFDSNINILDEFTYTIDMTNEEIPAMNGGLCESKHPYIRIDFNNNDIYSTPIKVIIPTTEGIVALEITEQVKKIDYDIKENNHQTGIQQKMFNDYSYIYNNGSLNIYKGEELIKTVRSINYYEEFKYICVLEDNTYSIYELK